MARTRLRQLIAMRDMQGQRGHSPAITALAPWPAPSPMGIARRRETGSLLPAPQTGRTGGRSAAAGTIPRQMNPTSPVAMS